MQGGPRDRRNEDVCKRTSSNEEGFGTFSVDSVPVLFILYYYLTTMILIEVLITIAFFIFTTLNIN